MDLEDVLAANRAFLIPSTSRTSLSSGESIDIPTSLTGFFVLHLPDLTVLFYLNLALDATPGLPSLRVNPQRRHDTQEQDFQALWGRSLLPHLRKPRYIRMSRRTTLRTYLSFDASESLSRLPFDPLQVELLSTPRHPKMPSVVPVVIPIASGSRWDARDVRGGIMPPASVFKTGTERSPILTGIVGSVYQGP